MKIVLYHDHCQDGFFSAYLAWKKFKDCDAKFISVSHRPVLDLDPIEALGYILKQKQISINDCKEATLYVFDFCFPPNFLSVYKDLFKSIIILDHHQTSFEELRQDYSYIVNDKGWFYFKPAENLEVFFSTEESSAKLVYKHFYTDSDVPWYIELVSDRDLGKNYFQDTNKFYHGITLYKPYEFTCIDYLVETDFKDIIALGELVERNRLSVVKEIASNLVTIELKHGNDYHKGAIVNTDLSNASDVANYILFCIKEHDFCLLYNIKNNQVAHCSIRSTHKFNSLIISEKFKGGGHKTSGGFGIDLKDLFDILNNNFLIIE
jgi:hypothetical protein